MTDIRNSVAGMGADVAVALPYFEDDDLLDVSEAVRAVDAQARAAIDRGEIKPNPYRMTLFHSDGSYPAVLFVGAGNRLEWDALRQLRSAAAAVAHLTTRGYANVALVHRGDLSGLDFARAALEGAVRGPYDPGLRKSADTSKVRLGTVTLISGAPREGLESGARIGRIIGESANLARDLVNLPPNDLTPRTFATRAQALAAEYGLACEVMDEHHMRELGMGSLLGVASGSVEPPRVIVLRYGTLASPIRLALVGKGITFDSGGLSLKPADGMVTMKGDMGGAAAVVAAMVAIARLGTDGISVTGYVGSTENMPSGSAMRPGDVLTALNGETIEVLNTDAEGRLVLADVLAYAVEQDATHIVDVATLTGGAMVALGHEATLAAGSPMEWVQRVVAAADHGLERAWPMPLYDEYRRAMDSDVADIKNTGGRYGSALTASAFLKDFVGEIPWTHLDIAGTAWADEPSPYQPKGGTGAAVGTLVSLASEMSLEAKKVPR